MSNQYTYKVPFTEEQISHDYHQLNMSQSEIAAKYGTTQKVVWKAMLKMGISCRISAKRNQHGELNSSWRGGRVLVAKTKSGRPYGSNGYWYVLDPTHPNANKSGYVAEHIAVATRERGRPLSRGEHVHHVNLDKHDNEPNNLAIASNSKHALWHYQLEHIAATFLVDGLIGFDPVRGYFRK